MDGFPSKGQWVGFILGVFVASIAINLVTRLDPSGTLAAIQSGAFLQRTA